jgi:hypothetical protein
MLAGMLQDIIQHLRRSNPWPIADDANRAGKISVRPALRKGAGCCALLTGLCLVAICDAWLSRDIERPHVCMAMPGIHALPTPM